MAATHRAEKKQRQDVPLCKSSGTRGVAVKAAAASAFKQPVKHSSPYGVVRNSDEQSFCDPTRNVSEFGPLVNGSIVMSVSYLQGVKVTLPICIVQLKCRRIVSGCAMPDPEHALLRPEPGQPCPGNSRHSSCADTRRSPTGRRTGG